MIGNHNKFLFTAFEIMLSCYKSFDNYLKLIFMGFILKFNQNYFLKKVGYQILSLWIV